MTKREKIQTVDIDDTEENEDWLRTPETRKSEAEIHKALRKEHAGGE